MYSCLYRILFQTVFLLGPPLWGGYCTNFVSPGVVVHRSSLSILYCGMVRMVGYQNNLIKVNYVLIKVKLILSNQITEKPILIVNRKFIPPIKFKHDHQFQLQNHSSQHIVAAINTPSKAFSMRKNLLKLQQSRLFALRMPWMVYL